LLRSEVAVFDVPGKLEPEGRGVVKRDWVDLTQSILELETKLPPVAPLEFGDALSTTS
jgi:hypothetical protein